jgi:hypothetical protein
MLNARRSVRLSAQTFDDERLIECLNKALKQHDTTE